MGVRRNMDLGPGEIYGCTNIEGAWNMINIMSQQVIHHRRADKEH